MVVLDSRGAVRISERARRAEPVLEARTGPHMCTLGRLPAPSQSDRVSNAEGLLCAPRGYYCILQFLHEPARKDRTVTV